MVFLLVFFLNGFVHYEFVSSLEECTRQGNSLVSAGTINSYQCVKVQSFKE